MNPKKANSTAVLLTFAAAALAISGCAVPPEAAAPPPVQRPPATEKAPYTIAGVTIAASTDEDWEVSGYRGAVACGGEDSMAAGMRILIAGGNAFDSAAATLLALTVTDYTKFCFGGEVPIIAYSGEFDVTEVFCGQGAAPELADLDYFTSTGGIPGPSSESNTNVAVPAALHAILTILDRYGTMTFEEVAAPALELLEKHETSWQADMAATMRVLVAADVAVRAHGAGREAGILAVADEFYGYEGKIARRLIKWCEENGALLRHDDLARHETFVEDPVSVEYKGYTVCKCDAWTQGPYFLQTLKMLEAFDLAAMGHNSANYIHTLVEALKLCLADRDAYLGDPVYVEVPLEELLSDEYIELRRKLIDPSAASLEVRPGDPYGMTAVLPDEDRPGGPGGPIDDTTTCIVADRWGNIVVATPSGWGGVLAGDTGIWLNSRLSSFNTWEGHPNVIEPGKRPRITLTPTLVFREGVPVMAISVAGGDWQEQVGLNLFMNAVEFGFSPGRAVTLPRFGTAHLTTSFGQKEPVLGSLEVNEGVAPEVIAELASRGHRVEIRKGSYWSPSMMTFDPETGLITAAGDPGASRHSGAF